MLSARPVRTEPARARASKSRRRAPRGAARAGAGDLRAVVRRDGRLEAEGVLGRPLLVRRAARLEEGVLAADAGAHDVGLLVGDGRAAAEAARGARGPRGQALPPELAAEVVLARARRVRRRPHGLAHLLAEAAPLRAPELGVHLADAADRRVVARAGHLLAERRGRRPLAPEGHDGRLGHREHVHGRRRVGRAGFMYPGRFRSGS